MVKNVTVKKLLHEGNNVQWVTILPEGTVINEGGILTQEGFILKDTQTSNNDQHRLIRPKRDLNSENPMYFKGRLAVISSPGSENWYHWLLQVLPRLIILQESGIEYDRIYINNLKYEWQKQSLNALLNELKIPEDKLLIINGDVIVQASYLIVPSVPFIPSVREQLPQWLVLRLRQIFLNPNFSQIETCDKIYISRKNASCRRITNESALTNELQRRGYKIVYLESLSPYDQARIFNKAKIIIGPHGSGFANLLFISEGCQIIEIDHCMHPPRSFYKTMASMMHCTYRPFYCENVTEECLDNDITVNVAKFLQVLEKI